MIVGVVTARGGSKGVPRKSIRLMNGKPLMAYTIEAALESRLLDRVIVSTDDAEMAEVGRQYGAEVPFIRPSELALDNTPTLPVLQHAVRYLEAAEQIRPTAVLTLQPTSPFRTAAHIDAGIELFSSTDCDSVVAVSSSKAHPYWMKVLDEDRLLPYDPSAPDITRRQDLPPVFHLNGALFITRYRTLMEENKILGPDTRALVMDRVSSLDIDEPIDFLLAEAVMQRGRSGYLE